jgi:hypothetical protein
MFVTGVHARGFRDLPDLTLKGLGRSVDLQGPTPATTALADAIELAFAALSASSLEAMLLRWGVLAIGEQPEVTGQPFPEQASWEDQTAARALVADEHERNLRVDLTVALDPPMFGILRSEAAREPRVVAALGQGASVRIAVGALFTSTFDTMALTIHEVGLGDERFPVRGGERPRWMDRLLRAVADRYHRWDPEVDTAGVALEAMTSRDRYAASEAWQAALGPDGPRLRAARGPGGHPILLGDDLPLRRHGRGAVDDAGLAAAVHLSRADIVWAETDRAWLLDAVEGDDSPLEQVFRVHPAGERTVTAAPPDAPKPTRSLPTTLRAAPDGPQDQ